MSKPEAQTIEYKSSWQDEYFEWICGYANVKGGKLYIGVNDDGYVVGIKDVKYLLDTLPNQIVSSMGIVVEIDHDVIYDRGENFKYQSVPADIAMKPENLYVRGFLTKKALSDIVADPVNTTNVTPEVQKLFDAAPGFVKQLRKSREYRDKITTDLEQWEIDKLVHVNQDNSLDYVWISVHSYSSYGISYNGHYYIRSGGTTRELRGPELSEFLMERAGKHWDDMPIPGLSVSDLDATAINEYRKKVVEKDQHAETSINVPDKQIISDLKLIDKTSGQLKRAAALLFYPDPEEYVAGAYVKIAYFAPEGAYGANKSDDIIYHDEVHGPLILQVDKVVELVYTKYLKALTSYEGLQRIETYMMPKEAFREVILNAINHKLYESGNPIQISVYEDKIIVFNQGHWPEDIELEDIYVKKHSSYPHNPNLIKTFFEAGEIEAYGSGFDKIRIECDRYRAPYPDLKVTPNGVTVIINACDLYMKILRHGRYWNTYPDNKEVAMVTYEDGEWITTEDGAPIVVETNVDSETLKSIDRMMEILSRELKESEKELYLPIADYLKTHETIKNAEVMEITHKGSSSANRYLTRLVDLEVLDPDGEKRGRIYRRRKG